MNIEKIKITELKDHPKNEYFFDNVTGEKWEDFLKSISELGIKEPLIITQDKIIVSGHQRKRAAAKLNIKEVPCIIQEYNSEDEILRDLIELNIRQRGVMADSETKQGRRYKELKRIYGIENGGDRKSVAQLEQLKSKHDDPDQISTSTELANKYGVSRQKMDRSIQVAESDETLQNLNIDGKVTGDTIRFMMSKMTPEQREEFLLSYEDVDKIRKKDAEEYLEKQKESDEKIARLQGNLDAAAEGIQRQSERMREKIAEIKRLKRLDRRLEPGMDVQEKMACLESDVEEANEEREKAITEKEKAIEEKEKIMDELEKLKAQVEELNMKNRENAELRQQLSEKDSIIKNLQEDTTTINNAAFLERGKKDVYRALDGTAELGELTMDAKKFFELNLAPLKYKKCFERVEVSDVARNNVSELLDIVQTWIDDVRPFVTGEDRNVIDVDVDLDI